MIAWLLHRIVANPTVYNLVQTLAGEKKIHRILAQRTAGLRQDWVVVDLGGGTGLYRDLWQPAARYTCLDIDMDKLRGFRAKHPTEAAFLADGARIPLADGSVHAVLFTFVAHHIDGCVLPSVLGEAARILKADGHLVFVEPLWKPRRLASRLLWRYDRGSFPRTALVLQQMIGERFVPKHWEQFAIFHEYALCIARPR